jgi:hypothetical protein
MKRFFQSTRGLTTPDSSRGSSSRARTVTKPDLDKPVRLYAWMALGFMACAVLLGPVMAIAQTTGSAPTFNATVQGQSASTVEGTFGNVVNYIGNVICPVGAAVMVAACVVQVRSGKGWVGSAITAVCLLAVSGITRLIESMVTNGQTALK